MHTHSAQSCAILHAGTHMEKGHPADWINHVQWYTPGFKLLHKQVRRSLVAVPRTKASHYFVERVFRREDISPRRHLVETCLA